MTPIHDVYIERNIDIGSPGTSLMEASRVSFMLKEVIIEGEGSISNAFI